MLHAPISVFMKKMPKQLRAGNERKLRKGNESVDWTKLFERTIAKDIPSGQKNFFIIMW